MDDPTHPVELDTASFEALRIGCPVEDLEGIIEDLLQGKLSDVDKEALRDEESLREAIVKGGLKNKPFSSFISTINMSDAGGQGQGAADRRRVLLAILFHRICPSLVFCQELPGVFNEDWGKIKNLVGRISVDPKRFDSIKNEDQAAVIWDTKVFRKIGTSYMTTDRHVIRIRDDLMKKGLPVAELLSRIAMVRLQRLTGTGPDDGDAASSANAEPGSEKIPRFLAVSYHGKHNIAMNSKKEICSALIEFLREIGVDEGIPYVLGGDFNYNSLDTEIKGLVIPGYELTPRGEEKQLTNTKYISHKDNLIHVRSR